MYFCNSDQYSISFLWYLYFVLWARPTCLKRSFVSSPKPDRLPRATANKDFLRIFVLFPSCSFISPVESPIMLNVHYGESPLCWKSTMLNVHFVECPLCWMSTMLNILKVQMLNVPEPSLLNSSTVSPVWSSSQSSSVVEFPNQSPLLSSFPPLLGDPWRPCLKMAKMTKMTIFRHGRQGSSGKPGSHKMFLKSDFERENSKKRNSYLKTVSLWRCGDRGCREVSKIH